MITRAGLPVLCGTLNVSGNLLMPIQKRLLLYLVAYEKKYEKIYCYTSRKIFSINTSGGPRLCASFKVWPTVHLSLTPLVYSLLKPEEEVLILTNCFSQLTTLFSTIQT